MRPTMVGWVLALSVSLIASGCANGDGGTGDDGGGGNGGGGGGGGNRNLVVPEAARTGAFGLRINVGPTVQSQIIGGPWDSVLFDRTPTNTPDVVSKFGMRLDGLDLGPSERIDVLRGLSADDTVQFALSVLGPDNRLVLRSRQDTGPDVMTPPSAPLPPGYNFIDVLWDTRAGGLLNMLVNEVPQPGHFGFTNTARVETVQFGVIESDLDGDTEGFVDFDDYVGHKGLEAFNIQRDPVMAQGTSPDDVDFPPPDVAYLGFGFDGTPQVYVIDGGVPAGSQINIEPNHRLLTCFDPDCGVPGGNLGGDRIQLSTVVPCRVTGTGALSGLSLLLKVRGVMEWDTGPRPPTTGTQTFQTDVFSWVAIVDPNPEFQDLTIIAGTNNGRPSPGSTTITEQPSGDFVVDSFFDIDYEISWSGAPGGTLEGMSGSNTGTIRLEGVADPLIFADGFESGDTTAWSDTQP